MQASLEALRGVAIKAAVKYIKTFFLLTILINISSSYINNILM